MPLITDKFCKVCDGTGRYPNVASVTASRTSGDQIIYCDSLSGWPDDTPVHFSTYRTKTDGTPDPDTQSDWKGIKQDNTITGLVWTAGNPDTGNQVGDRLEINPTIAWANDMVMAFLSVLNQAGGLKSGSVTADALSNDVFSNEAAVSKLITVSDVDIQDGDDMPGGSLLYVVTR